MIWSCVWVNEFAAPSMRKNYRIFCNCWKYIWYRCPFLE